MSPFMVSYILLWIVVGVSVVALAVLYSALGAGALTNARPKSGHDHVHPGEGQGPDLGILIEVPVLVDVRGEVVGPRVRRWLFLSRGCPACDSVKTALREQETVERGPSTVIVFNGDATDVLDWAADVPSWIPVVVDGDRRIAQLFNVEREPYIVGVDSSGTCRTKGTIPVDLDARRSMSDYLRSLTDSDVDSAAVGMS